MWLPRYLNSEVIIKIIVYSLELSYYGPWGPIFENTPVTIEKVTLKHNLYQKVTLKHNLII